VTSAQALSLLVFALGAFTIPMLCRRIGLPAAVGEILFGIAVGPHLLGWLEPSGFTSFLSEFGLAFLMFLAGLELDFPRLESQSRRRLAIGGSVPLLLFALALGATVLLGLPPFMALILGAVSLGIPLATLRELKMLRSAVGQNAIFVGSLAEFLTIVLLTGFEMYVRIGLSGLLLEEMSKLALVFFAAYALLVVLRTALWWWPHGFARLVAEHDPSEAAVRASMAMMLVFVALASLMGVESILGAFIAGALVAFVVRDKHVLEAKMSSLGFGFFVPLFFISVGANFDVRLVTELSVLPAVALLFAASLGCKLLGSLPLVGAGMRLREVAAMGLLLSAPLSLLVVIANVGVHAHVIDEATAAAVVLLAIVSAVISPWLFRALARVLIPAALKAPVVDRAGPRRP
jgi:Kef-type K+ transport system membrane component KefB